MTFVVQLRLHTSAHDEAVLNTRFNLAKHIQNVLVKEARKCLHDLEQDHEYWHTLSLYRRETDKLQKKEIGAQLKLLRESHGVSKSHLEQYVKVQQHMFKQNIDSQACQKIAARVFQGVEKYLYGNGKKLNYVKEVTTICGKQNCTGIRYVKETLVWNGLKIKVNIPADNEYIIEALAYGNPKYCAVKRRMFNNGWHWYLLLTIDGIPPKKNRIISQGKVGIDIGVSTVAVCSDTALILEKLAPDVSRYNRKIASIQRYMDRSKRHSNPQYYDQAGRIKKGKKHWIYSNGYRKANRQLKSTYASKALYIQNCHEQLANRILELGDEVVVEHMNFKGLQKKAKKTERKSTPIMIKGKPVYPYKRKKRFGKSLNDRAPASLISIIDRKLHYEEKEIHKVNPMKYRASQYHHDTNEYVKHKLHERWKTIEGHQVQRDLYSGFLLMNCNDTYRQSDQSTCRKQFSSFLSMHTDLIQNMKNQHISCRACFGF